LSISQPAAGSSENRVTIERLREVDIPQAKAVVTQTWQATYRDLLPPQVIDEALRTWYAEERLREQARDPRIYFAVYRDQRGEIVGVVTSRKVDNETVSIGRLYVLPERQGQGIGTRLLEEGINAFPEAKSVTLQVEEANLRTIAYYKRHGFLETGRRDVSVGGSQIPVILMEKRLI
jgi:ribosomal protein S18 acetylase RimI-like enzyme